MDHSKRDLAKTASAVRSIIYGAFIFAMGIGLIFCISNTMWRIIAPIVVAAFGAFVFYTGVKRYKAAVLKGEDTADGGSDD